MRLSFHRFLRNNPNYIFIKWLILILCGKIQFCINNMIQLSRTKCLMCILVSLVYIPLTLKQHRLFSINTCCGSAGSSIS